MVWKMRTVKGILLAALGLFVLAAPAAGKVGDPVATFASSPLMNQLALTSQSPVPLSGPFAGALHRFVSDDGTLTVDLVVRDGRIAQQIIYLPIDLQRGVQVSFFLQDAIGSVFGATQGLIAFRAAVTNRVETYLPFGNYIMRFTPLDATRLRVLVSGR